MAVTKSHPIRNKVYPLSYILQGLILGDSPALRFEHKKTITVVQDSCATQEDLLSIPGFGETEWVYQRTTDEDIPLFLYVGDPDILQFVDVEPVLYDPHNEDPYWATPKGFYQKQYEPHCS